jgi:hypothetical protein
MRLSVSRPEFGLMAAGAVTRSLIGQLRSRRRLIGPIAGVSLRVASRIANVLDAGFAARSPDELDSVRSVLFYSPPEHLAALLDLLAAAAITWEGKNLIFCDADISAALMQSFRDRGAAVAAVRRILGKSTAVIESDVPALVTARRVAADAGLQTFEIPAGNGELFAAALAICSAGLTPLIDRAANLLRRAGLRDADAVRLAARIVSQTANDYSHSGKQSWQWHVRPPDADRLAAALAAAPEDQREFVRELILSGFTDFNKHPEIAQRLRESQ